MNIKQNYQRYFVNASVLNKLIIINVFVFIMQALSMGYLKKFFSLPLDIFDFIVQPWSLITYGFLHGSFRHILYNMIWLYVFGQFFLNIHTGRRFLNLYFLGVLFGALVNLLAFNLLSIPYYSPNAILVGASAGVYAVMVATTVQSPNLPLRFLFIPITFKLWWITVGVIALNLLDWSSNFGGKIAHLAGALAGYLYMTQLQKGNDIGGFIGNTFDTLLNAFKPKEKSNLKTVYKATAKKTSTSISLKNGQQPSQQQIDQILDKISKSGYESLSKKEKALLFKAGKQ